MTTPEIIELVKEWKDEMKQVVGDYNRMLHKLDEAVTAVEESKSKWWVVHKSLITFVVTACVLLIFVIGVAVTMKLTNMCIVNVDPKASAAINSCQSTTNPDSTQLKAKE